MSRLVKQVEQNIEQFLVIENGRRSTQRFVSSLLALRGAQCDFLGSFTVGGENYSLPRFTFRGPNSSEPIRIGLFAAIHGDEPAGAVAAVGFPPELVRHPPLAENFLLEIYPLFNPTGFEDNTPCSLPRRAPSPDSWRGLPPTDP